MTPAKRQPQPQPATPASQGPKRPRVPDVPIAPPVRGVGTKDDAQLLGPEGEPIAQEAATRDANVDPEHPETTQSQRRPRGRYPLPVWPD